MVNEKKLVNVLLRRFERLQKELVLDTPAVVKKLELQSIVDVCQKLLKIYK